MTDDRTETIHDRAAIRATDDPDPFRRNPVAQTGPDDPWRFTRFVADDHECVIVRDEYDEPAPFGSCSTHRRALSSPVALGCATPAPVSGAGPCGNATDGLPISECQKRPEGCPCFPASGAGLNLDAIEYRTRVSPAPHRADVAALIAEVRRLTAVDDDLSRQIHETGGLLERAQAAVDAEAEAGTLRARLAAVEAELEELRHWTRHDRPRLVAVEALTGSGATPDGEPLPEWVSVHDLRAALATTGEGE